MTSPSRRDFLKRSMYLGAAAVAAGPLKLVPARVCKEGSSKMRKLGIPTVTPYCTSYRDLSECCRSCCFSLYDVATFSRNSTSLLEVSVIQKG